MIRFSKIPNCIAESALAADRATEQELTGRQKKNFEFWTSFICVVLLFSAAIGVRLWKMYGGTVWKG